MTIDHGPRIPISVPEAVTVERRLIPAALAALQRGRPPEGLPAEDMTALHEAGILHDFTPSARARVLLEPLAAPTLVVTVRSIPASSAATIWRLHGRMTIGSTTDGAMFELAQIDPALAAFTLAGIIRLQTQDVRSRQPRTLDHGDLTTLRGSGRAVSWRLATIWSEWDGTVGDKELHLLDFRPGGYWRARSERGATIVIQPFGFDEVLDLLADTVDPG